MIVFSRGIAVAGEVIDVLGVVAIVVGVLYAAVDAGVRGLRRISPVYTRFKRVLAAPSCWASNCSSRPTSSRRSR